MIKYSSHAVCIGISVNIHSKDMDIHHGDICLYKVLDHMHNTARPVRGLSH